MSQILIDAVGKVTIAAGLVRIDCLMAGPDKEMRPSGTLLITGAQAAPVLNSLVNAMKELQRRAQEQAIPPTQQ
jgi:hypothetical protein